MIWPFVPYAHTPATEVALLRLQLVSAQMWEPSNTEKIRWLQEEIACNYNFLDVQ